MYYLYIATGPTNVKYVGITSNVKRRLKEHQTSPFPFGRAVREHGIENFKIEVLETEDMEEALSLEAWMIGDAEVSSDLYYNACRGGTLSNVLLGKNPMHDPDVVAKHPTLFSSTNNPMLNPKSKQKMVESQKRKAVSVLGKEYAGVREAARVIGISRQCLVHRLKSLTFPEYSYV